MNKLFPLLAFAAFALVACSEDKPEATHAELCAKVPVVKECLLGRWFLESVEGNSECKPNDMLENSLNLLQEKGELRFSFKGGYSVYELETNGTWELNDSVMKIGCKFGNCDKRINYPIDATIEVRSSGSKLRITTNNGFTSFLQCSVGISSEKYTEIFSRQGQ